MVPSRAKLHTKTKDPLGNVNNSPTSSNMETTDMAWEGKETLQVKQHADAPTLNKARKTTLDMKKTTRCSPSHPPILEGPSLWLIGLPEITPTDGPTTNSRVHAEGSQSSPAVGRRTRGSARAPSPEVILRVL